MASGHPGSSTDSLVTEQRPPGQCRDLDFSQATMRAIAMIRLFVGGWVGG